MRKLTIAGLLLLTATLSAAPPDVEALLGEAELETARFEFRRAEEIYGHVLAAVPDHFEGLIGLAKTAGAVGEQPRAAAIYRRAADLKPSRPEPALGLGGLALFLDRKDEARRWFVEALSLAPDDPECLAALARVEIEEREYERAAQLISRAVAAGPPATAVLVARSELSFRTGDMTSAAADLRSILEIEPLHLGANQRLSNGFRELDRPPYRPPEVPRPYLLAVRRGEARYRDLDLDAAETEFAPLDTAEAPDGRPAVFRGLIRLRRGRLREAEQFLLRAVAIEPDCDRFRNALCVAWRKKVASQRPEYGGGADAENRLGTIANALPQPEVAGLASMVRGFTRLLPEERAVVGRAVRPFEAYLPALRGAAVKHDILGLEQGACDAEERRYLANRRTHDGRLYEAIRGLGGRNAATGLESILSAAELRYDTFAHEFAHQVHEFGFDAADKAVIESLYRRAVAGGRCLDYYAATNDREYFAQGYEAFVSVVKSPFHHSLRRHTRAELRARDPGLYRLIIRLTGTEDPDPTLLALAVPIREFYVWAGDGVELGRTADLLAPWLNLVGADSR